MRAGACSSVRSLSNATRYARTLQYAENSIETGAGRGDRERAVER